MSLAFSVEQSGGVVRTKQLSLGSYKIILRIPKSWTVGDLRKYRHPAARKENQDAEDGKGLESGAIGRTRLHSAQLPRRSGTGCEKSVRSDAHQNLKRSRNFDTESISARLTNGGKLRGYSYGMSTSAKLPGVAAFTAAITRSM
jgi:hypothetical protein